MPKFAMKALSSAGLAFLLATAVSPGLAFGDDVSLKPSTDELNGDVEVVEEEHEAILSKLEDLKQSQTQDEIDAILSSSLPAELLFDDNNDVVAAYYTEQPSVSPLIAKRGPGCASGDACAWLGSVPNGWYGTGSMSTGLYYGVRRIEAGNAYTNFSLSGSGWGSHLSPGQAANYGPGGVDFDRLERHY